MEEHLRNKIERLEQENKRLRQMNIDTLKLFDFKRDGGYLSVEAMNKIMGREFLIYQTKFMNVVESRS